MYEDVDIELPPNVDYDMSKKAPNVIKQSENWRRGNWILFEPKTYEAARLRKLRGYLGAVSQVDHAVGQILDCVDELEIAEDTIVIYTSDHGDYAAEHDLMEKAPGISSDAITRIPMIWQWKGHFKAGHRADEIVESVDMSQTVSALCGLEPFETSDGYDISHLLRGESGEVHKVGVTEFAWSKSVRKGDYRFVYYPVDMFKDEYPEGFGELYNIKDDPYEMTNLYFDERYDVVVRDMRIELTEWLITTTRPTTCHNVKPSETNQGVTRFGRTVNHDGKFDNRRLRDVAGSNYL
jgi:arylsulfatase A-like enzyme